MGGGETERKWENRKQFKRATGLTAMTLLGKRSRKRGGIFKVKTELNRLKLRRESEKVEKYAERSLKYLIF